MLYHAPQGNAEQEIVYKTVGDREILMYYMPPTQKKYDRAPVYLVIPGGGWHTTSYQSMIGFSRPSIDALRARGWATVSIAYRLTTEGATIDEIISDCMDAGRYLAHFADELGIDCRRVLVSGHSAGAHLALMLSHAPHAGFVCDSPFDAVADDFTVIGCAPMSPITFLYDREGTAPVSFRFERLFREGVYDLAAAHRASPLDYVNPLSVPTLIMCGTHDALVYPANSTHFCERCHAVGAPCEIVYSHLGGHCFEPLVEGAPSYPGMPVMQQKIAAFAEQFE